jgi:hypothetical protein
MILGESSSIMAPHNIQISPKTIGKLLKEEGLRVPPSQRSYRWKEEHVDELYKDIKAAMEKDSPPTEYFLGSVVSISSDGILIYDGQQRLATVMLLIAAIRNALLALGNERDAEIAERTYLFSDRRGSDGPAPHLVMNLEDKDYFFDELLPRPTPKPKRATVTRMRDSHKRMLVASKNASDFVAALTKLDNPAEADARLNEWLNYIDSSLYIIWVQVLDARTAFTIFETMNDRGLKLSAADLLKNFLHATAGDEQEREEIMHKWAGMTSVLETVEGEEDNIVEYVR